MQLHRKETNFTQSFWKRNNFTFSNITLVVDFLWVDLQQRALLSRNSVQKKIMKLSLMFKGDLKRKFLLIQINGTVE